MKQTGVGLAGASKLGRTQQEGTAAVAGATQLSWAGREGKDM